MTQLTAFETLLNATLGVAYDDDVLRDAQDIVATYVEKRKASSKSKTDENEKLIQSVIVPYINGLADGEVRTAKEVYNANSAEFRSVQKVGYLLRAAADKGLIVRTKTDKVLTYSKI